MTNANKGINREPAAKIGETDAEAALPSALPNTSPSCSDAVPMKKFDQKEETTNEASNSRNALLLSWSGRGALEVSS
jgi:hypothetical protein